MAWITFSKITRSLDNKAIKIIQYKQKIQALEAELERLRPKKKRKVQIDLNDRFASIKQIIKAKEAATQTTMPLEVANALIFKDICFEQALFDLVVSSDTREVDDLHPGSIEPADRMAR